MKFKKYIVLFLLLCEFISLFLTCKSFSNKEVNEIKETYEVKKETFSMFIENEEGIYAEYTSSNLFPEGYEINVEKSKCVDTKGNVIDGILSGSGTNIMVKSSTTSYCYLYFDIKEPTAADTLIANAGDDLWASTLEDDGYRFVGTNPDNYICFGTTDTSTCTSDTDKYMYRIIGIFKDSSGEQHLKIIKKEALNTTYVWHSVYSTDTDWDSSTLFKGLNGSYFLSNSSYSYMQDTNWTNKIATWNYTATNTKTDGSLGMNYYSSVVRQTYLHEMNRSTKSSSVGVWDTVSSKIGLMYVSDYQLSLGSTALDYTNSTSAHYQSMKTGWMHISNNDSVAPGPYEWTMSRYGVLSNDGVYRAWNVDQTGYIAAESVDAVRRSARPVFYLISDVKISGEGTSTNPYIIS